MRHAGTPQLVVALALGVCALQSSFARPATYKCGETLEFKVDFTPRKAQLHLEQKQYTLVRIKSAHDAHYVNRKAGMTLIAKKGDLSLREGGRVHGCKLQVTP